jgi:flagellin-like protein
MLVSKRAVSPIISTILLLGIIVTGVAFVYFLGIPIITRMQDTSMIRRVENSMLLLGDNVLTVVNEGHGSERITQFSYGKGTLFVYSNFATINFQLLNNTNVLNEYSETLGKVEYSVETLSNIIPSDSSLYVRGWVSNVVNGTQGVPNMDLNRIVLQRIGPAYVLLLLDFRSRLFNYTDSNGDIHITISIVKLAIDPSLSSGIGSGTFQFSSNNQGVTVTNYNYTFANSGVFKVRASQDGVAENAFTCYVDAGKNVNVEFLVTEVEVGIL